ncbi:hypothetical protein DIPPA_14939 [Diplonema papillatum]|nr:hypothetical protein DIPPA_17960 [Diplonema papillatum]KAJ9466075.1 hypothetical protein DIPPA_14939 [Diplonema papillatum]
MQLGDDTDGTGRGVGGSCREDNGLPTDAFSGAPQATVSESAGGAGSNAEEALRWEPARLKEAGTPPGLGSGGRNGPVAPLSGVAANELAAGEEHSSTDSFRSRTADGYSGMPPSPTERSSAGCVSHTSSATVPPPLMRDDTDGTGRGVGGCREDNGLPTDAFSGAPQATVSESAGGAGSNGGAAEAGTPPGLGSGGRNGPVAPLSGVAANELAAGEEHSSTDSFRSRTADGYSGMPPSPTERSSAGCVSHTSSATVPPPLLCDDTDGAGRGVGGFWNRSCREDNGLPTDAFSGAPQATVSESAGGAGSNAEEALRWEPARLKEAGTPPGLGSGGRNGPVAPLSGVAANELAAGEEHSSTDSFRSRVGRQGAQQLVAAPTNRRLNTDQGI